MALVRAEPAPRLMAVNIDEGEPGTFKDRYYLERDPHRFLEGMLIAAWAVGSAEVYIYLRDEYAAAARSCESEIAALRSRSALRAAADPPAARRRRLHLRRRVGDDRDRSKASAACRAMRPPYVAQVGLFGRPTLEHNMETLYWVRDILEKGADWFAGHGRHGRKGLRCFSVSGRVKKPGVHAGAGRHHGARADRRILRRHADGPRVLRLPAGRRLGRHPAGGAWPTSRSTSTRCSRTAASSARPR